MCTQGHHCSSQRVSNARVREWVAEQRVLSTGERGTEAKRSKAGISDTCPAVCELIIGLPVR